MCYYHLPFLIGRLDSPSWHSLQQVHTSNTLILGILWMLCPSTMNLWRRWLNQNLTKVSGAVTVGVVGYWSIGFTLMRHSAAGSHKKCPHFEHSLDQESERMLISQTSKFSFELFTPRILQKKHTISFHFARWHVCRMYGFTERCALKSLFQNWTPST